MFIVPGDLDFQSGQARDQTHLSCVWHKSVQGLLRYFIHRQKNRLMAPESDLPQFIACGNIYISLFDRKSTLNKEISKDY